MSAQLKPSTSLTSRSELTTWADKRRSPRQVPGDVWDRRSVNQSQSDALPIAATRSASHGGKDASTIQETHRYGRGIGRRSLYDGRTRTHANIGCCLPRHASSCYGSQAAASCRRLQLGAGALRLAREPMALAAWVLRPRRCAGDATRHRRARANSPVSGQLLCARALAMGRKRLGMGARALGPRLTLRSDVRFQPLGVRSQAHLQLLPSARVARFNWTAAGTKSSKTLSRPLNASRTPKGQPCVISSIPRLGKLTSEGRRSLVPSL